MNKEQERILGELAALAARMRTLETRAGTDNDLVSIKNSRIAFGISEVTARRWVKKGLGVKRGGRLYLSRSKIVGTDPD